tara:strand:+ start:471 stop:983 length:513 start_codon:yes stop_codon:yes gene_type:complete
MSLYYKTKFNIKTFADEINAKEITHFQRTKEGYIELYSVIHCNGCDEMYQWDQPIEYRGPHTDQDIINIINALGAEYNGKRPFSHIKYNNWENDIQTKYTGYKTTPDDIGAHESDGEAYCYSCHDKLTEKVGIYGEKLDQNSYDHNDPIDKPMVYDFIVINDNVYTKEGK